MTHGFANVVAHQALLPPDHSPPTDDDLVNAQYSGPKAGLRSVYDLLTARVATFGEDVVFSPKKAYVSLRRSKQFALIQPSTRTRVDVGLCLKGVEPTDRLELAGSFNAMVTHRVRVSNEVEVDAELLEWLKQAYQKA